jgi:Bacterial PH domain
MSKRTSSLMKLPEKLPQGEIVLWCGRPSWRSLALRAFHVKKVGIYFGLILAWQAVLELQQQFPWQGIAANLIPILLLGVGAIGILALLAWIYCRTTTYTITNRRVFMRFGAALPMMLNLPFRVIGSAAAKVHRDGTADIPLRLLGDGRVAYLVLWPHARPWHITHPEPMLRSVPDGARIVALLASALTTSTPPPLSQAAEITKEDAPIGASTSPGLASAAA